MPYYQDDQVTLYHGDCREITEWLAGDVLVTDPPYGIAFVSSWTTRTRPIAGDRDVALRESVLALWGERPALVFGTWRAPRPAATRQVLVWDKTDGVGPGMGDLAAPFGTSHEEIYVLGGWPRPKSTPRRGSVLRSAIAMGNPSGLVATSGHPTPKPVPLMEALILTCPPGTIADPCTGSGSTLIAARNLGRPAIGVEIEEAYCETAARRLAQDCLPLATP